MIGCHVGTRRVGDASGESNRRGQGAKAFDLLGAREANGRIGRCRRLEHEENVNRSLLRRRVVC